MILDKATHKTLLLQILKDIYSDPQLGPVLGFKGGTAAFMFYELNRFSVDLDFDLLDHSKKTFVFDHIENILKKYGALKKSLIKRYTLFFLLSYKELAYNIKVEINIRDFGSKFHIQNYFGVPMKVMVQEDMVANKLVALLERKGETNRDIYDAWFFLTHHWPINEEIITLRTEKPFKVFIKDCIKILEKVSNRHILSGIGELLTPEQKIWVKKNLISDVLFLLKTKI